jgi:Fe-S-cluster-containing dehydrogenase component
LTDSRPAVVADWSQCRGCQVCQLICSFRRDQAFNPTRAAVQVGRLGGETEFGVTFTADCDRCGSCVKYCLYGALSREEVGAEVEKGGLGDDS